MNPYDKIMDLTSGEYTSTFHLRQELERQRAALVTVFENAKQFVYLQKRNACNAEQAHYYDLRMKELRDLQKEILE